eukprot:scaffold28041_cov21-Cyclotella_meneghiniana.AAC.1
MVSLVSMMTTVRVVGINGDDDGVEYIIESDDNRQVIEADSSKNVDWNKCICLDGVVGINGDDDGVE